MQREYLVRIVDDDVGFLNSQRFLLEIDGHHVATYRSAEEFLQKDDFRKPGCLILDVRMPGMTGLQLQDILEQRGSFLPIIFLSAHGDINMAVHTLKHGAFDFIPKPASPERLKDAVRKALEVSSRHFYEMDEMRGRREKFAQLTQREQEVLTLVAEGMSNKDIAEKLFISLATVKMHRLNACKKLGISSAVEAAHFLRDMEEK